MAEVKDVVCDMILDSDTATARSTYQGQTYYFCTEACRDQFESNPAYYVSRGQVADSTAAADDEIELEKHEPPFTKSGGVVAPKFGSAGSGGLEYELGPEQHGKESSRD